MVTPWRRWWRRGGDDGDSAKDLVRSHQIQWDLTKSDNQLLGTAKTQDRQWRSDLLSTANLATNSSARQKPKIDGGDQTSSARQKPKIDGGDRTTPTVEFTTEVSFCETEKKMREGKGDGGREEWGRGEKNEKKIRGERISELYESFVKSKELAGYWSGISGRVRAG